MGDQDRRDDVMAYWARWRWAALALPLKARARELGYNLVLHGSLARDIDLVAVPWVAEAVPAEQLVEELRLLIAQHNTDGTPGTVLNGGPSSKPHGRRAWSIDIGTTYLDLSVLPLAAPQGGNHEGLW